MVHVKRDVKFVVIESPYAPFTKGDPALAAIELARNEAYVNACVHDAFKRGEVPFASHAIYTRKGVLDDTKPEERKQGMQAGFDIADALALIAWAWDSINPLLAERIKNPTSFTRAFYVDRGYTSGMVDAMYLAGKNGQLIEKRTLDKTGPVGYWSRENDRDFYLKDGVLGTPSPVTPSMLSMLPSVVQV